MIAGLVQRLIDAGTPPLVAATVVSEAFAAGASARTVGGLSADETTERRRAYDRERQRLKRLAARKSADSPPTSADSADADNNNLSSYPHKDSIDRKEKKVRARPKKSADFLPDDWQPKDGHFAAADRLKLPHSAVHSKAEDMRLWAKANGVARSDWDAVLHTFLRKDADKLRGRHETTGNVIAAADRLLERVRAFDDRPGGIRDGTGQNPVRLLSEG